MYENANSRLTYNDDISHADGSGQKFLFLFDSAGKNLISCLFNVTTTFVVIEYNDDLCCFQAVCSRRRSA